MQKTFSFQFDKLYAPLKDHFYVNVPFPLPPSMIDNAMQAFFKFLAEPELTKSHIDFNIAPLHRRGDIGFKHRNANDHLYNDNKDFFHFHPDIFQKYPDFLARHPVVQDFCLKAKPIWDLAYQTVYEILLAFEPNFPKTCEKIFATESVHLILRFLKYDWDHSGKYLAKPHYDAGSFTLAIAESGPGLRIGSGPENLKLVQHQPQNAVFMLSSNFQKVIQTDELAAAWHDVIQLDETFIGKPYARWALVTFIEAHGVEAMPRSVTHQWFTESTADE